MMSSGSVCSVARRHGLSLQQSFGWRCQLREAAGDHSEAEELRFVPAVVDALVPARALGRRARWRSARPSRIPGSSRSKSMGSRSGPVVEWTPQ
ncbi:hypothetical protein [Bradyrhizobium sp. 41S5]|uniref:hypothetical protein n=1 Tax=Bradyrhizobium sp. 41S5 TaxID=1404443 RepID=UPI0035300529